MAYNTPRRPDGKKYTSVRLTGLFKTRKRGLCVGTIQQEIIVKLIDKIKEAKRLGKELTVFLWVNDKKDEENQPYFTVSVDVAQDRPTRGKAIEADPFADDDFLDSNAGNKKGSDDDVPF